MRHFLPSLCLAVSTLLAACGGGGGDAPAAATVTVGGLLAGLGAGKSVVIADAGGQSASLAANGSYRLAIAQGTAYNLRIQAQPAGQTCTVANGTGTANADVNNISVVCADDAVPTDARTVSGTIAGLGGGKTVVLLLTTASGTQETTVNADGSFSFAQPVVGSYTITVKTAPAGQACTVASGSTIAVTCASASSSFRLGGTVSGNAGVVAVRNNANGDTVTLNANGAFTFAQPVLQASSYQVVVFDQSAGQTCSVAGGAGTASADVVGIQVSCAAVVVVAPPPAPVVAVPAVPANLTMTYSVKSFNLAWGTVTAPVGGGSVTYRVFEDPDGAGPVAGTQVGGTLSSATYTRVITGLLHTRIGAQYTVQACNSAGCGSPTAAVTANITEAIGYFKASNTGNTDNFGQKVALSADGNTLAVATTAEQSNATGVNNGSQADNSMNQAGAVYVFTRAAGVWSQQAYVKASNTAAGDRFGASLALSGDGNTLAVGAVGEDSNATGINGDDTDNSVSNAGAVYVFTRGGGVWSQQAYVKASRNTGQARVLGDSVALSSDGNTLAVGGRGDGSSFGGVNGNQDDNSATTSGAVYVFVRSGAGVWSQQAYVKASNPDSLDFFGFALALSADGQTLAVGAIQEASNATGINGNQLDNSIGRAGAVYVFTRSGVTWSQQAYLKSASNSAADEFGSHLALSGNGDTLAVGVEWEDSSSTGINGNPADDSSTNTGAVYIFSRSGVTWGQQAYIKASAVGNNDFFGASVSLSLDGNTLAVGAYGEAGGTTGFNGDQADNTMPNAGAAYLFARSGTVWSQQAYVKAGNTGAADQFGYSVALSGDGATLAVGAITEDSNATGVGGNQGSNSSSASGAVYVY